MTKLELIARIGMPLGLVEHQAAERPKGAYYRLLKQLGAACHARVIESGYYMTASEKIEVEKRIFEFGRVTRWEGKPRHVMTYVSFCLSLMESVRGSEDIIKELNAISARFERFGESRMACMAAGALALEKWEEIWRRKDKIIFERTIPPGHRDYSWALTAARAAREELDGWMRAVSKLYPSVFKEEAQ